MARPRAADYEDRKQLIRDRAAEMCASRGFTSTAIADIAASCGMAKSLVYHYFGAKDDILYDLLVGHVSQLLAAAEAALEGAVDPRARLRAYVRAHIRLYTGAWARHRLLLNALGDLSVVVLRHVEQEPGVVLQRTSPDRAYPVGERLPELGAPVRHRVRALGRPCSPH